VLDAAAGAANGSSRSTRAPLAPAPPPAELDCHFESICESCTYFQTTLEFRPTLQRQRNDAADKGQIARLKIFDGLPHASRRGHHELGEAVCLRACPVHDD
jgi:hypothetical protein